MKFITLILAVLAFAGCDNNHQQQAQYQQQQYQQQPPVQYQQPPQQGIGTGTAIVGAAAVGTAAYLLGKNAGAKATAPTTVVQAAPQPKPSYNYAPAKPVAPVVMAKPAAPIVMSKPSSYTPKPVFSGGSSAKSKK